MKTPVYILRDGSMIIWVYSTIEKARIDRAKIAGSEITEFIPE